MLNLKSLRQFFEKKAIKIDKRIRLVISVSILGLLMLFSTFFNFDKASFFLPVFIIATYLLSYFSLLEGIKKISWFGLFLMPELITLFFYLFYFLFPGRWLTRLPFIFIYEISIYAVLLCANIFNVGVEKNLQLYRAAFSINFFYQAVVSFLFYNVLFSFRYLFFFNIIGAGISAFLLSLQLFWSIRLNPYLERDILAYSLFTGLLMVETCLLVSFLPLRTAVYALFLTATYYSVTGIIHHHIDEKLFTETIREYASVWAFVLIITLLSLSW
ncbi:hypothetical protein CO165_03010 [Candidatus Roizmanbacteria bacterium CG_4_9_14_3_um_filter_33_18]|uniref:Uncharacterized protein n=3 Tax=Candidatus Roizmaniibacteriota TaxID=1752723 RepID=A0A2M7U8E5_9BACT|nr:MAG: hypothetical protein COW97_03795 [Candidatus Roizmanbacteria bacterium CG22_combo_CG10-13_8_21_14_all_34_12]PIZ67495.1 MAG: hypothetical protein COY12_01865 [Candidatus Roizmanbacteria bacterium CG_4_10_14_0_2_um_filter_33_96]PJA55542.1 MAG: hypothetical protein CO165_03010 [Candidatus Roizmanbacteria bacterium CG_4_9_14_3_um_filter_33_18]